MGSIAFILIAAITSVVISILYYPLQKWVQRWHDDQFAEMMGWNKKKGKEKS